MTSPDPSTAVSLPFYWLLRNRSVRQALVLCWHLTGILLATILAFQLRFDFQLPDVYRDVLLQTLPFSAAIFIVVFALFGLNSGLWAYFSLDDIFRTAKAIGVGTVVLALVVYFMNRFSFMHFPRSVFITNFMLLGLWEAAGRSAVRWYKLHRVVAPSKMPALEKRCVIIGGLSHADVLIRGTRQLAAEVGDVVAVVCDETGSRHMRMHGVQVLGPVSEIGEICRKLDVANLLIAAPYHGPKQIRTIVDSCAAEEVHCTYRVMPALEDIASGRLDVSILRQVQIEDLLYREPARFDRGVIDGFIRGKRILVTGAGGSIGSEICRQVAAHGAAGLVLFEFSEYALYRIEQELAGAFPEVSLLAYTGDARDAGHLRDAMERAGGVDVLYHAAAYKHVPMMERNVPACFQNVVLASAVVARTAAECGVRRFVLISTDKAVRPTSVMGACKRLAERVVLEQPGRATEYVAVRFGNVLGSSGSVVPLFKRQIAAGGPVTVTSPGATRYFMTIPEAVELVLMAGIVGDGQVMVLEMGQPVKIIDLARRLIELSGLIPDRDIQVEIVGMRPGEKESEELLTDDENVVKTEHDKIWVLARDGPSTLPPVDLAEIERGVAARDVPALKAYIGRAVPDGAFPAAAVPDAAPSSSTELVR